MKETIDKPETLEFRAEVRQLLHILANSLYTDREIFLRELISNASDALHRVQFEMLTNRDILDPEAELAVRIDADEEDRTLTVADTGIGMTREELVENLGTIAHSGVASFLERIEEGDGPADIIGQFGVGFYSVFTVADRVTVTTRAFRPQSQGWRWTSDGEGRFALEPADKGDRGTSIRIHLQEDAAEFASHWRLKQIIKKHSDYVSFPIYVGGDRVNRQTALWRKLPQDVEEKEYEDLYRQLTLDPEPPLAHIHLVTDLPVDIRSILFVPRQRSEGLISLRPETGLKLYAKKILIQEQNDDLLPDYLSFVKGVVDSESLPLNISRETVQSSRALRSIRRALTGRLLRTLRELAEDDPDDYKTFWRAFGPFIKQGAATDRANRDDLLPLLRFQSTRSDGDPASLRDYVERMSDDQEAIYYVLADDVAAAEHSPHLDLFKQRGVEVLYFLDPVDGLLARTLEEYDDRPFENVSDPDLTLPHDDPPEDVEPEVAEADLEAVIRRFEQILGGRVNEVRASHRLTESPCRLISTDGAYDKDLRRIRRLLGEEEDLPPLILEINARHPIIRELAEKIGSQSEERLVRLTVEQLFDNLLLLDGLHPNPARMVPRIYAFIEAAARSSRSAASQKDS